MTLLKTIARCGLNTLLSVVDHKWPINTYRGISAFGTLPPGLYSRPSLSLLAHCRVWGRNYTTMNECAIDKTIRTTDYYILWDLSSTDMITRCAACTRYKGPTAGETWWWEMSRADECGSWQSHYIYYAHLRREELVERLKSYQKEEITQVRSDYWDVQIMKLTKKVLSLWKPKILMPIEICTSTIQGVKPLYSNERKCNDGEVQQGADWCRDWRSYASFQLEELKVSPAGGCTGVY